MFFVDGAMKPTISGTGAKIISSGAWGFKDHPFSYQLYGAPIVGKGGRGPNQRVPLSSRFADRFQDVFQSDHRTRQCKPPLG